MPYEPDPDQDPPGPRQLAFEAIREVRHTVIRVITAHLQRGAAVSWQGLNFDFTGVTFDGGDFRLAQFSGGTANFSAAQFSGGTVDFSEAVDWSLPPAFPWTDTPPSSVKLPRREDISQS
jgi:hypothetical protein